MKRVNALEAACYERKSRDESENENGSFARFSSTS